MGSPMRRPPDDGARPQTARRQLRRPRSARDDAGRTAGSGPPANEPASRRSGAVPRLLCSTGERGRTLLCNAVSLLARMGTDPWRKPASEARRVAARRTMTKLNARRIKSDGIVPPGSLPYHGIAPLLAEVSAVVPTWTTTGVHLALKTELHREQSGEGDSRDGSRRGLPAPET